jgi:uncharacterized protein (DUF1501 family)
MNRRTFLKSGFASFGVSSSNLFLGSGLGMLSNLSAASSSAPTDFKTLVMVFLHGGMDSLGLIVPSQNGPYERYKNIRQNLAFEQDALIDFGLADFGAPVFCQNMTNLYQGGKLAWVANVGPLRQPTTKQMIEQNTNAMPIFIGSHNSQVNLWQSGGMNPNAREGWGARMLELMQLQSTVITPNISLDKSQLFTSTLNMPTFTVDPRGVSNIPRIYDENMVPDEQALFYDLQNLQRTNLLGAELGTRNIRTLESSAELSAILKNTNDTSVMYPPTTGHAASNFQQQLKMAARLIEAAPSLNQNRQVIMVHLPYLVSALFENLESFQSDIEARAVDQRVVTFSQSDFGRTPTINANGTDHGWGGHYFVMGSSVKGGQLIGEVPAFDVETDKMLFNLSIPDISVEQYASNLAKWFGLSQSATLEVFPGLANFDDVDFGLFR